MPFRILFLLGVLVTLSACVDRGKADEKLAKGCAAAVEQFLPEGQSIKEITNKVYGESSELGKGYRYVTLRALETDGWSDADKEYRCIFEEQFGFLGGGYTAVIYQVRVNDEVYGKKDGQILGTFEDHLKLEQAVEKAMR